jgi:hypothetical protein
MILPVSTIPLAQSIAATFDPSNAVMWTTMLAANGSSEPTHGISTGYLSTAWGVMVPSQTWAMDNDGVWVLVDSTSGDAQAVAAHAQAEGLQVTTDKVQALFDSADITAQDPWIAMVRLGLTLCADSGQ